MPLSFQCEVCQRPIHVADGSEGMKVDCPTCYTLLTVPHRTGERPSGGDPFQEEPKPSEEPEDPLDITDPESSKPRWTSE